MTDIIDRLRSNQPLVICPYNSKSPDYLTTPDDEQCKFCGQLPDGPNKCTGADTRIMGEAADEIQRLRQISSVNGWLCVKEYPPPKDNDIIGYYEEYGVIYNIWISSETGKTHVVGHGKVKGTMTHWMPLLPPPTKGNE
jgi:hypothetical protein